MPPLKQQGVIDGWHDRQLTAGNEWTSEINSHLNSAALILLLVSKDVVASPYCHDIEMKRAMKRHEIGVARVNPIIPKPVDWQYLPFSGLQALPTDGKPITKWKNRDEGFTNVASGIRNVIHELKGGSRIGTINHSEKQKRILEESFPEGAKDWCLDLVELSQESYDIRIAGKCDNERHGHDPGPESVFLRWFPDSISEG